MVFPQAAVLLKAVMSRVFSTLSLLIPAQNKKVAANLYEASQDPDKAEIIAPVREQFRATTIGDAAWRYQEKLRKKASKKEVPEDNTSWLLDLI